MAIPAVALSAQSDHAAASDARALAGTLVGNIFDAYRNYTRPGFTDLVSEDFSPSQIDLINTVERSFYANSMIDITYSMNKVLPSGDAIGAGFTWQKRAKPLRAKKPVLTKGSSVFTFKNVSGKWLLSQISGDLPF